jgi:hypothetical protein
LRIESRAATSALRALFLSSGEEGVLFWLRACFRVSAAFCVVSAGARRVHKGGNGLIA